MSGANPLQVALNVSLPMIGPAILFAGVLVFFLGFELFGLPLVLGDPQDILVLSTYLFKLTNKLGVPSYLLTSTILGVMAQRLVRTLCEKCKEPTELPQNIVDEINSIVIICRIKFIG